jgi:hypothetical protein
VDKKKDKIIDIQQGNYNKIIDDKLWDIGKKIDFLDEHLKEEKE